jgi:DoxX-like family
MFAATVVVSLLLAAALSFAAARKLSHREDVVRSYARAGVPEDRLDLLAGILVTGAAGLIIGLAWAPIGVAAALALVVYFLVAVGFHIRAGDGANVPMPALLAAIAAGDAALRLAT